MKYLQDGWENLFQRIKKVVKDYENVNWVWSSINIAVWEPDTNPPELLRKFVAEEVLREDNANHTYWDNSSPVWLNKKLVELNTWINVDEFSHLSTLLIPWEKSMIWLLPIACWANWPGLSIPNKWYMKNAPAYDVLSTWAEYLGEDCFVWPIYSFDNFKLRVSNIPEWKLPRMIITVKPWNPCPVWASREEWIEVIEFCIKNKIRLVNDWAYTAVVHKNHVSLTSVAKDYQELEWVELFSLSKTYSACGWRMWVAVWTSDFINDLTKIKWNTDSWVFWPAWVWLNKYLETDQSKIDNKNIQKMYRQRLDILIPIFEAAGLKLSCPSDAWFFMLFACPSYLNGEKIESSEDFNNKMINAVWLVWVPFVWSEIDWKKEQFIRYSACYDSLKASNVERLKEALSKVEIK